MCPKQFAYPLSFKKHLRNSHAETVGANNDQWEGFCKVLKSSEGTAIRSHESSPVVDNNMQDDEKENMEESVMSNRIELSSKKASMENSEISSEYIAKDKTIKKSRAKERKKRAVSTKRRATAADKAQHKKRGAPSHAKNTPRKTKTKLASNRAKENPIVNDVRGKVNVMEVKERLFNGNAVRDSLERDNLKQSNWKEEDTPKSVTNAGVLRQGLPNFALNESIGDNKLPQKRTQTFFIERPQGKKLTQSAPLSQEFAQKLFKAQIDQNKIITFSSLKTKSEDIKTPMQSRLPEQPGQQYTKPLDSNDSMLEAAKNLSARPATALDFVEHCHIHTDGCGHVQVFHKDHVDFIHNGELHFVNKAKKAFPHKLTISKTNPDGCMPICSKKDENNGVLEEITTPHV